MNDHAIVGRVRDLGGFVGPVEARRAIRATLAAIGERLHDEQRAVLGGELPWSLSLAFAQSEYGGDFDRDELFERVAEHEHTDPSLAAEHARIVCGVLGVALGESAVCRLRVDLGPDIAALFDAGGTSEPDESSERHTDVVGSTLAWVEDVSEYATSE